MINHGDLDRVSAEALVTASWPDEDAVAQDVLAAYTEALRARER